MCGFTGWYNNPIYNFDKVIHKFTGIKSSNPIFGEVSGEKYKIYIL